MFTEPGWRGGAAVAARPGKLASVCFVALHAWPVLSGDRVVPVIGGAEVQQAILARLLARRGHRVSMICLDYGQRDGAVVDGVAVRKAFAVHQGVPGLRSLYPRLTSLWRALRAVDADIYYYRSADLWAGVTAEFCRRHGRKLVYAGASDKDFDPDQGGQIRYARALKPGGAFALGMIEGDTEEYRTSSGMDQARWFSYYQRDELVQRVEKHGFALMHEETFKPGSRQYFNLLFKRM